MASLTKTLDFYATDHQSFLTSEAPAAQSGDAGPRCMATCPVAILDIW